jgi:hypothetical protein
MPLIEPDFVIVPRPNPLSKLWEAFPELRSELDDGDSEPYNPYARFADHIASHADDDMLWQRSYAFFEALAADGLEDILVIAVFEPLCDDPAAAERLQRNAGIRTLRLLRSMRTESE